MAIILAVAILAIAAAIAFYWLFAS